jgi:hypothetical protein
MPRRHGHRRLQLRRHTRLLLLLPFALAVTSCRDASAPDAPGGPHLAVFDAPAAHRNGAALIELTGAGIDTVIASIGQLFMHREGDVVRVAIVATTPGPLDFVIELQPGSRIPAVRIIEVADEHNQLRPSLDGYAVRFFR